MRLEKQLRMLTLLLVFSFSAGCNSSHQQSEDLAEGNQGTNLVPSEVPSRYGGGEFFSYPPGKSVGVGLGTPRGPKWNDDSANPPLSAIDAINAGIRKQRVLFPDTDSRVWQLRGAKLKPWDAPNGYWFWELTFDWSVTEGVRVGFINELRLAVLMDGTVIEPEIKDRD